MGVQAVRGLLAAAAILGALLSDILLGKYLTIMILSIVYCIGHGALALMGLGEGIDPGWMLFLGLGLISFGSGGIKPCVSAHVGDQFGASNGHMLSKIFGWFYFSINVGAFVSTLLTPWFLEWYGPHLAFGVPGVLMCIATFLFWCGRKKFVHVPAGGMKWFRETFSWQGISAILKLGVDRVMWGSDYPHDEGTFPYSQDVIERTFAGISAEDKRKIVHDNAKRMYGFA